ncbi:YaaC family protein [Streptomyces sp. ATCC 21386]|uniref:YaaC family protein n=1 Tax=Streptomyces sp. ATCC 21386 TaxID=2699428 RepID=UPI001BFEF382|nr:YaaC family protein [Streptomyces sp. ATCC 21386]
MDGTTLVRVALRHRRTSLLDKTLLKDSASRRHTFAAALQQFEEQLHAARVVSAATRPINLYYGLVQAGLAMAAAHVPGTWTFNKHGLKALNMESAIPDVSVRPDGSGAFQAVSDATGSPRTENAISIGSLWNSIPELAEVPITGLTTAPAVTLIADSRPVVQPRMGRAAPRPAKAVEYLSATVCVNNDLPEPQDRKAWLEDFLPKYPGLNGGQLLGSAADSFRQIRPGRFTVEFCWPAPRNGMEAAEIDSFFDARAPQYRFVADRYLRPTLEPGKTPPTPLMSWWLLLYTFSMLARYQPRKWSEALDVDRSRSAAALEYALDVALEVVPHLVLEGLDQDLLLLAKPIAF